jgi:hypothetical protein
MGSFDCLFKWDVYDYNPPYEFSFQLENRQECNYLSVSKHSSLFYNKNIYDFGHDRKEYFKTFCKSCPVVNVM